MGTNDRRKEDKCIAPTQQGHSPAGRGPISGELSLPHNVTESSEETPQPRSSEHQSFVETINTPLSLCSEGPNVDHSQVHHVPPGTTSAAAASTPTTVPVNTTTQQQITHDAHMDWLAQGPAGTQISAEHQSVNETDVGGEGHDEDGVTTEISRKTTTSKCCILHLRLLPVALV